MLKKTPEEFRNLCLPFVNVIIDKEHLVPSEDTRRVLAVAVGMGYMAKEKELANG